MLPIRMMIEKEIIAYKAKAEKKDKNELSDAWHWRSVYAHRQNE